MRLSSRHPLVRRAAAVALCGMFGLLVAPGVAAGASVTFGTPSFKSTFGKGIVFTQPFSGGSFKQADIAIYYPDAVEPAVEAIADPGSSTLTYSLDGTGGGLTPFEPVVAHFQIILADGTIQAGPDIHVTYADDRYTWKVKAGKFVTMHWIDGTDAFGQALLGYGEAAVPKSAAFLGATETKTVDFYIYPSQAAFQAGLSAAETVGGQALPEYRTCFALVAPSDLAYGSTVVPHELTHVVYSDVIGHAYHSPPDWLNEGLAVYLSEGYGSSDRRLVSQAVRDGSLMPLRSLAGYFFLDPAHIYLSYAEAVSAVDFMIRQNGKPAIQKLLQTYAIGATDDEAFTAALGMDMTAFDQAWLADNKATASETYGPQPAPTGPVPPGWSSGTIPPVAPTASPAASAAPGSTPPADQGPGSPGRSDDTVLVLAALIAVGGLILLGAGTLLDLQARREETPLGGPPS
jgi:hypothetical protein